MTTERNGLKDFLAAFGVWSGIVVVWQFVEYRREQEKTRKGTDELRKQLTRIESKLK